uniref:Uncharacterized protein n=1 Tax=Bombyx mori TaxID=7091 RepID=A0A8R2R3D1_BOMMO|nr:uncharacterized protein LOC119629752 [Bombyx mori]
MESKHITLTALISIQALEMIRATNNPTLNLTNALKIRSDLVEETFLEQKDVLLDMLEAKLKEVRDKKKSHKSPNKADIKLSANGIVALGESDINLKYGNNGNANLNLNATGISNVGKIRLDMASGDRAVNLPGLDTLFNGIFLLRVFVC